MFLDLLAGCEIAAIADVRRFPGSRRHPQFGQEALRSALADCGIAYEWVPRLGGRRRPAADSVNTAWRNPAFRGFADYTGTPEFEAGFQQLLDLALQRPTAIMCAEQVWWRCHRSIIADVLVARGIGVLHILDADRVVSHPVRSL